MCVSVQSAAWRCRSCRTGTSFRRWEKEPMESMKPFIISRSCQFKDCARFSQSLAHAHFRRALHPSSHSSPLLPGLCSLSLFFLSSSWCSEWGCWWTNRRRRRSRWRWSIPHRPKSAPTTWRRRSASIRSVNTEPSMSRIVDEGWGSKCISLQA